MKYRVLTLAIKAPAGRREFDVTLSSDRSHVEDVVTAPYDETSARRSLKAFWEEDLLGTDAPKKLKHVGETLHKHVFHDRIGAAFRNELDDARQAGEGLRIRVLLPPGSPWVANLPFETFYCRDAVKDFLALSGGLTLVRGSHGTSASIKPIKPPLQMLIAGASPKDLRPLDLPKEVKNVRQAVNLPGLIQTHEQITGCTMATLMARLRSIDPHVLHFVGHGKEGAIYLEDMDGRSAPLKGDLLRQLFKAAPGLRLVVLNCCHGNSGDSSVALSVANLGIPAVVAHQTRISDRAAIVFSEALFQSMALGMPIDEATWLARLHILQRLDGSVEWATPALYLNAQDGNVLGLSSPPGDMLRHASGALDKGNWHATKSIVALLRHQHPQADETTAAQHLECVAHHCDRFAQSYGEAEAATHLSDLEEWLSKLGGLLHDATATLPLLEEREQGLAGAPVRVVRAMRAVNAFGAREYQQARQLCQERDGPLDLSFLLTLCQEEELAQERLDDLEAAWCAADWDALRREAAESTVVSSRLVRQRRAIAEMEEKVKRLAACLALIEAPDLPKAHESMQELTELGLPPGGDTVIRILAIGKEAVQTRADAEAEPNGATQGQGDAFAALAGLKARLDAITAADPSASSLPGYREVFDFLNQQGAQAAYQTAAQLYKAGQFPRAGELFRQAVGHKDADAFASQCDTWLKVMGDLEARDWESARKKLGTLRSEGRAAAWRAVLHRGLPQLERLAGCDLIRDPSVPWPGGDCPYLLLAEQKLAPDSPHDRCVEASFDLLDNGGMSAEQRAAWEALRATEKRLLVDFSLFAVTRRERVEEVLARHARVGDCLGDPPSLVAIAQELEEDGGVFLALIGDHEGATAHLLEQVRRRPADVTALHHLGLAAAAWLASLPEETEPSETEEATELLLLSFGAVFASDDFWHRWWGARRRIYQARINQEQVEEARRSLCLFWSERLRQFGGEPLGTAFQAELAGAAAMQQAGGMPDQDDRPIILGPRGARALGLSGRVGGWGAGLADPAVAARLARAFSELAIPASLFAQRRFDAVVAELSRSRCHHRSADRRCPDAARAPVVAAPDCPCYAETNPVFAALEGGHGRLEDAAAELLQQAQYERGLEAASRFPPEVGEAVRFWRAAVAVAQQRYQEAAQVEQICQAVLGRVRAMQERDHGGDPLPALDANVSLLTAVREQNWEAGQAIRTALANALLDRAVHLANKYHDHDAARQDASRAYKLSPKSLRVICNLIQASLNSALSHLVRGRGAHAEALRDQAADLIEEGSTLYPGNPDLRSLEGSIAELNKQLAGAKPESLGKLLDQIRQSGLEQASDRWAQTLSEAQYHESRKEFRVAADLYWQLHQAEPGRAEVLVRLGWCYREWLWHLSRLDLTHSIEARQIWEEAQKRCPGTEALRDVPFDFFEE